MNANAFYKTQEAKNKQILKTKQGGTKEKTSMAIRIKSKKGAKHPMN